MTLRASNAGTCHVQQCRSSKQVRVRALQTTTPLAPSAGTSLALKEWAVTIGALGSGQQTVLLRKGGIREPAFKLEGPEFLLFPTSFHSKTDLLKSSAAEQFAQEMHLEPRQEQHLHLSVYAQLTGGWVTDDPGVLSATNALHVWGPAFLETRLKWRPKQPITVLELRAWRLAQPVRLTVLEALFGCFSWVDVAQAAEGPVDLHGAQPALDEAAFQKQQVVLRQAMQSLGARALDLTF